ncbi:MAG TPA: hypothetical protein VHI98_00540 [Vicinamibacterales bacterium]|nr:hypothetical protein [Vicinamibacterales bacterium]
MAGFILSWPAGLSQPPSRVMTTGRGQRYSSTAKMNKKRPVLDPCPYCKSTSFMEGERSGDEWIWSCGNPPCMFKRGIERRDQIIDVTAAVISNEQAAR